MKMLFIFGSLRDATLGKKIFLGVIIALFFELSSRIGGAISLRYFDAVFLNILKLNLGKFIMLTKLIMLSLFKL
jgi:lipopolysaccharide export system permease protein